MKSQVIFITGKLKDNFDTTVTNEWDVTFYSKPVGN